MSNPKVHLEIFIINLNQLFIIYETNYFAQEAFDGHLTVIARLKLISTGKVSHSI